MNNTRIIDCRLEGNMCEALPLLEDGIELEKYGEIYAAPTLNVFVLSCLRCQNPYMQLQDFLWHIQWEHAEMTQTASDSGHENATVATVTAEEPAKPKPADEANATQSASNEANVPTPAVICNGNTEGAEDSVIAAKRILLSDLDDIDTVPEVEITAVVVADQTQVTSDVVELNVTIGSRTAESDEEAFEEVEVIDEEPEVIDITSDDMDMDQLGLTHLPPNEPHSLSDGPNLLPEPVSALNETATNAVNNKHSMQCEPGGSATATTTMKAANAAHAYRSHAALQVRSLADIKKLLKERFKQQARETNREGFFTCTFCGKLFNSRKIRKMHLQHCHDIT